MKQRRQKVTLENSSHVTSQPPGLTTVRHILFAPFSKLTLHGIFTPIVSTQIRPCHITVAGLHAAVAAGSLREILHLRSNGQSIHEGTNTNLTAKLT